MAIGTGTAILGGALISGFLGDRAASKSAGAISDASNASAAVQREMYQTTRADLAPYREAGVPALQRLMYLIGLPMPNDKPLAPTREQFTKTEPVAGDGGTLRQMAFDPRQSGWGQAQGGMGRFLGGATGKSTFDQEGFDAATTKYNEELKAWEEAQAKQATDPEFGSLMRPFTNEDFEKDPGYQFRLDEGEKALERGALARGLNASSATLKNLMRFNQGLASDEYGAAFARHDLNRANKFNMLSYIAGTGQNAAAMTGQAGANMASGVSQAIMAGGAGAAAGYMGSGSAWNNAIQGGLSNMMYQQRFEQMMKRFPVFAPSMGASGTTTGFTI